MMRRRNYKWSFRRKIWKRGYLLD